MGHKHRKLSHHENKMRDIARSTLPSRNRWPYVARHVRRYENRRERNHVRAVFANVLKEDPGIDCHDDCRMCTMCSADLTAATIRMKGAVIGIRRRDSLGALLQWYENRVAKIHPTEREGWLRVNLPDNAAGRHAREHLQWQIEKAIENLRMQAECAGSDATGGQS